MVIMRKSRRQMIAMIMGKDLGEKEMAMEMEMARKKWLETSYWHAPRFRSIYHLDDASLPMDTPSSRPAFGLGSNSSPRSPNGPLPLHPTLSPTSSNTVSEDFYVSPLQIPLSPPPSSHPEHEPVPPDIVSKISDATPRGKGAEDAYFRPQLDSTLAQIRPLATELVSMFSRTVFVHPNLGCGPLPRSCPSSFDYHPEFERAAPPTTLLETPDGSIKLKNPEDACFHPQSCVDGRSLDSLAYHSGSGSMSLNAPLQRPLDRNSPSPHSPTNPSHHRSQFGHTPPLESRDVASYGLPPATNTKDASFQLKSDLDYDDLPMSPVATSRSSTLNTPSPDLENSHISSLPPTPPSPSPVKIGRSQAQSEANSIPPSDDEPNPVDGDPNIQTKDHIMVKAGLFPVFATINICLVCPDQNTQICQALGPLRASSLLLQAAAVLAACSVIYMRGNAMSSRILHASWALFFVLGLLCTTLQVFLYFWPSGNVATRIVVGILGGAFALQGLFFVGLHCNAGIPAFQCGGGDV